MTDLLGFADAVLTTTKEPYTIVIERDGDVIASVGMATEYWATEYYHETAQGAKAVGRSGDTVKLIHKGESLREYQHP